MHLERLTPRTPLPGLAPGIHALIWLDTRGKDVGGRVKPGHGDASRGRK
jgi:hypothetical protein